MLIGFVYSFIFIGIVTGWSQILVIDGVFEWLFLIGLIFIIQQVLYETISPWNGPIQAAQLIIF